AGGEVGCDGHLLVLLADPPNVVGREVEIDARRSVPRAAAEQQGHDVGSYADRDLVHRPLPFAQPGVTLTSPHSSRARLGLLHRSAGGVRQIVPAHLTSLRVASFSTSDGNFRS